MIIESEYIAKAKYPVSHKNHNKDIPCGCVTDIEKTPKIAICECGAMYDWMEVITFIRYRCYDCHSYNGTKGYLIVSNQNKELRNRMMDQKYPDMRRASLLYEASE